MPPLSASTHTHSVRIFVCDLILRARSGPMAKIYVFSHSFAMRAQRRRRRRRCDEPGWSIILSAFARPWPPPQFSVKFMCGGCAVVRARAQYSAARASNVRETRPDQRVVLRRRISMYNTHTASQSCWAGRWTCTRVLVPFFILNLVCVALYVARRSRCAQYLYVYNLYTGVYVSATLLHDPRARVFFMCCAHIHLRDLRTPRARVSFVMHRRRCRRRDHCHRESAHTYI